MQWQGLAIFVAANQAFQAEIEQPGYAILESCGPTGSLALVTRVAEAQVDLNRVRRARHWLTGSVHQLLCELPVPPRGCIMPSPNETEIRPETVVAWLLPLNVIVVEPSLL